MRIADSAHVATQYATEAGLANRRSVWRCWRSAAAVASSPAFIASENPLARVVATDLSPRMAELAASRGVAAQVADVQALPFEDGALDVVAALWMLYHVPDLDARSDAELAADPPFFEGPRTYAGATTVFLAR